MVVNVLKNSSRDESWRFVVKYAYSFLFVWWNLLLDKIRRKAGNKACNGGIIFTVDMNNCHHYLLYLLYFVKKLLMCAMSGLSRNSKWVEILFFTIWLDCIHDKLAEIVFCQFAWCWSSDNIAIVFEIIKNHYAVSHAWWKAKILFNH